MIITKMLLQAPCQVELENWVNSIHSACAAAFARCPQDGHDDEDGDGDDDDDGDGDDYDGDYDYHAWWW